MTAPLLNVEGLGCVRGGRRLFSALDLELRGGEVVAVTGANGSGKSTLLRCIAGLFSYYEGLISVAPFQFLGHRIGLSLRLSPRENVTWYAAMGTAVHTVDESLARLGLAGVANIPVYRLSAGQQRRAGLARLHCCGSRVWLLDEPYTALDTQGQQVVDELIAEQLAGGGAVMCATHQLLRVPGVRELNLHE